MPIENRISVAALVQPSSFIESKIENWQLMVDGLLEEDEKTGKPIKS